MGLAIQGFRTSHFFVDSTTAYENNVKKKYPYPKTPDHSQGCLRKLIRYLRREKDPIVDEIKKLAKAKGIIAIKDTKVIEAMQSIDFSSLKKELKIIIENMTHEEQKALLKKALWKDFENDQKLLGNRCLNLMTVKQLQSLSHEFKDIETTVKEFCEIHQTIKKYDVEEIRKKLIKDSKQCVVFRFISNLIRTLAAALNLLNLGKEPNTYFETKYLLDIYWMLIDIPLKIMKFIFSAIVNPLISLATIIVGSLVSAVTLHLFKKFFDKCPQDLSSFCKNLTAEIKNGNLKPSFGREETIREILEALAANNETGRKHPLLIGNSGIGKTELMKEIAWKLVNDDVPQVLKGKTLFYLNSSELIKKANVFDLKDPLEQIMQKIGKHRKDLIIVFDEADELVDTLGTRFNSILDTSPDSLFYAIGITTPERYKEKIETTNLNRRFKEIRMNETTKKQTKIILRHMKQQQNPEIKVSKKVLNTVYEKTKAITHRNQPDKAVFVLSHALEKITHLQNGGGFDVDMQKHMTEREKLLSKLRNKKLHGVSLKSEKIQKITGNLKNLEIVIEDVKNKIEHKKINSERYKKLQKQYDWHQKWFETTNQNIMHDMMKGKKTTAFLEKLYLFNSFFLLPELEQYLNDFVKEKQIDVEVTEKMIEEIVNRMGKQKNVENVNQ